MKGIKRNFIINLCWWVLVVPIWMSFADTEFTHSHPHIEGEHVHSFNFSFSFMVALLLASLNTLVEWRWGVNGFRYRVSFRKKLFLLFLNQFIFTIVAAIFLYVMIRFVIKLPVGDDFELFARRFDVMPFFIYAGIAAYVLEILKAIDQKLGPGNLWKLMLGKFSEPKEMERIFMFIDLRDSTTLAEKLGNIKYSQLLQDCFHDISVVQKYGAEVFQYVGDEVVLVWKPEDGLTSYNCIEAYFSFMDRINEKSNDYLMKYGHVPFFKAGIHIGTIVLAEVGEIKRDIAYHGDTINTASRIQKQCNDFDQALIVSEDLIRAFNGQEASVKYQFNELGIVSLKGKDETVNISGVQKNYAD